MQPDSSEPAESTSFVYKPPPQTPLELRRVHGPGLARLKINERGDVTEVTILESSGHKASDLEAADALRRWKAKPGPPREVERPLIWWIAGKRKP